MEKSKKKKEEDTYVLTPLGLLSMELGLEQAQEIMDALELAARRQNCNAVQLMTNQFIHVTSSF